MKTSGPAGAPQGSDASNLRANDDIFQVGENDFNLADFSQLGSEGQTTSRTTLREEIKTGPDNLRANPSQRPVKINELLSPTDIVSLRRRIREIQPGQLSDAKLISELQKTGTLDQSELHQKQDEILAQLRNDFKKFETTIQLPPDWKPSHNGSVQAEQPGASVIEGSIFDGFEDDEQNNDPRTTIPALIDQEAPAAKPEPLPEPTPEQINAPDIDLSRPSEEFLTNIPTLVNTIPAPLAGDQAQPRAMRRGPTKKGLFSKSSNYGKSLLATTSRMFKAKSPKLAITQEFKPFEEDTLYNDDARIDGIPEKVYRNWEGLRKETPAEEAKRLQDEELRLKEEVRLAAEARKRRLEEAAEEKKRKLGEEAYLVAQQAQKNYLQKIGHENKYTHDVKLRGNIFSNGYKKILKSIRTFTASAHTRHEESLVKAEAERRQKYLGDHPELINPSSDEGLTNPFVVVDPYLKEYDDDDTTLFVKADKLEKSKTKPVKKGFFGSLFTTSKEKERAKRREEEQKRDAISVIEWHKDSNVDPEKNIKQVEQALARINEKTKLQRESTIREVGPYANKFLSLLENGAQLIDSKINKKNRFRLGLTIAAGSALAMYAAPTLATVTLVGIVGTGMRVISAAGTYTMFKAALDARERVIDQMKDDVDDVETGEEDVSRKSKRPIQFTSLERQLISTGGLLGSIAVGQMFGHLVEFLWPDGHSHGPGRVDVVASPEQIAAHKQSLLEKAAQATKEAITPAIENTVSSIPKEVIPFVNHTMKPGESVWSLVKNILETSDYEGFKSLKDGAKDTMIMEAISKLPKDPTDYNIVQAGKTIDFSPIFTKLK